MTARDFTAGLTPEEKDWKAHCALSGSEHDALIAELQNPARQPAPHAFPYKLMFLGGLRWFRIYLFVAKEGTRTWRFDYLNQSSRKWETAELGCYPKMDLAEARKRHLQQRKRIAQDRFPVPRTLRYTWWSKYHLSFWG